MYVYTYSIQVQYSTVQYSTVQYSTVQVQKYCSYKNDLNARALLSTGN